LTKIIQDGGAIRFNQFLFKKSSFPKPPIIWGRLGIFTNINRQNIVLGSQISQIFHLFCEEKYFKMAEISKMAFGDFFNENHSFELR
jgi:hypothetical protein